MKPVSPSAQSTSSTGRRIAVLATLAAGLHLASPRALQAESFLEAKYQDYRETDGRIRVAAKYGLAQIDLNDATRLSVRGVVDTITGSSPTGEPAPAGSDQVPLGSLDDVRNAAIVSLAHTTGDWQLSGEFAWSDEHDYLSRGYSATVVRELNKKNTGLQFGLSFIDDSIKPAFFSVARPKTTRDFLIGVSQLLGPNTRITANLSYGTTSGYLDDPYKIVLKTTEIAPGLDLGLTFPEHRPSHKARVIGYFEIAHYLENLRAGIESSVRLFHDDEGINGTTFEAAWRQRLGEHLVIGPLARWYRQTAADYYYPNLDNTSIVPVVEPDANTPFYSSDYRLSAFDATTFGAKAVYHVNEHWAIDVSYERYTMRGRDDVTSRSAYATANILNFGGRFTF